MQKSNNKKFNKLKKLLCNLTKKQTYKIQQKRLLNRIKPTNKLKIHKQEKKRKKNKKKKKSQLNRLDKLSK